MACINVQPSPVESVACKSKLVSINVRRISVWLVCQSVSGVAMAKSSSHNLIMLTY